MATDFPASVVLSSFRLVEQMLDEVVQVIPYSEEHESVWSPQLVTVLLEACSQLDSLWKARLRLGPSASIGQATIKDYFGEFGSDVAHHWVVFWGERGMRIQPFQPWTDAAEYTKPHYQPTDWWQAYNAVKHDRLVNRKQATLRQAAHAVAGLFVAILRSPECAAAVAHAGWIPSPGSLGMGAENLLSDDSPVFGVVAESALLSHPINLEWKPGLPKATSMSVRSGSYRFQTWCAENGLAHWPRE